MSETTPLIQNEETVQFTQDDEGNPRNWTRKKKMGNVLIIALMAILSPLASSMFTPGISQIAEDLSTSDDTVIGATTGFVVMLGIGPLLLAPLSETFGRRVLYLVCFSVFSLLQIPTALSPSIATLIALRTIAGFFGSIGIANGGGTISDMFESSQRASIFGWYLLGPLLGPTIGPLLGGIVVQHLGWRWVFWLLSVLCLINTTVGFFFLRETFAPVILARRCAAKTTSSTRYHVKDADGRPLSVRLRSSLLRPLRILFTQPIVLTMAIYQAIVFGTMYTLYTNMQEIYTGLYGMSTTQVGLLYFGPGVGFLLAVWFLVPRIDSIYSQLSEKNGGSKPEYRLPLANIGAVLLPCSLLVFGWTIEYRVHWTVSIAATTLYGIGQVTIFNTVQNYYIDAFESAAASAIAAGAAFRSIVGGIVPLFMPALFRSLGYGWGWSVFALLSLLLAPAPLLLYKFGEKLRCKYAIDL